MTTHTGMTYMTAFASGEVPGAALIANAIEAQRALLLALYSVLPAQQAVVVPKRLPCFIVTVCASLQTNLLC